MGKLQDEIHEKYGLLYDSYCTEGVGEFVLELFKDKKGIALDVGAYHAKWINNTYLLEEAGWEAYCIEPNPNCIELLEGREHVYQFAAGAENKDNIDFFIYGGGNGPSGEAGGTGLIKLGAEYEHVARVVKVNMRTLDWFLETEKIDHVDFLSLDTERTELDVLKGIDLDRWNVQVIALEILDEPMEPSEQHAYMKTHNFKLVEKFMWNYIYIKRGSIWDV